MKTLLLGLLLATAAEAQSTGRLFLHMVPGFEVVVDGTSNGVTTADVAGKIVDLPPGAHHVVVRSTDGREGAFNVVIAEGQTKDVALSPLGLRKKLPTEEGEPGSLRLVCVPEECSASFREKDHLTNDDTIESIPAGRYPLVATQGSRTLKTNVDIASGMVITVEANFTTGAIRVAETKRRARHLTVAEVNDALSPLSVPSYWKSAIRGTLPAGVSVVQATPVGANGIRVTMRVPSDEVGYALIESFVNSNAFVKITLPNAPRKEQSSWLVDFTFYFPLGR